VPERSGEAKVAEYERSRLIQASPEDVFAFVSDVRNLPTFIPTVEAAEPEAKDRIRIRGEIHGHTFEDEGWFHVDEERRRLEWGADEHDYSGSLTVGAANGGSEVVIHLSLAPFVTESGRPITGELSEEPDPIEEGLEAALDSLRNLMEGRGGKEEPAAVG
jgi:hypothetical protein